MKTCSFLGQSSLNLNMSIFYLAHSVQVVLHSFYFEFHKNIDTASARNVTYALHHTQTCDTRNLYTVCEMLSCVLKNLSTIEFSKRCCLAGCFLAYLLEQQCLYGPSSVNLTLLQCSSLTSVQCSSLMTENVPSGMSVSGEEEVYGGQRILPIWKKSPVVLLHASIQKHNFPL